LSSISLSSYRLAIYTNGSATATATLTLPSYTLLTGRTYVLANNLSIAGILALANYSGSSAVLTFNGNDVIALERVSGGTKVDVV
jgi:predicted extracellular nuclease